MDTLQNMRVFARVVECGSFTAAAQRMNAKTSLVSRSVSDLETHLRTRLLNRTTRSIALTEAGERYLHRCQKILADVDAAELEAAGAHAHPAGRLRVYATPSLGQCFVAPAIALYRDRYPAVSVELTLGQEAPDLLEDGYDVVVRMSLGELPDSGLVAHRLGTSYSVLCASPAYLEGHGVPHTVEDLREYVCSQLVTPFFASDRWLFDGPKGPEDFVLPPASFRVNHADALAAALCAGMGIGALPAASALAPLRNGDLLRLLPEHRLETVQLHALYASRQYLDAKISTWVDLLREAVPATLLSIEVALRELAQATNIIQPTR